MEEFQNEVTELQLKYLGQVDVIEFNGMNELFYNELAKENNSIDNYSDLYEKLSNFYSQDYEENKKESDEHFVKKVIKDMKRLMEIAKKLDESNEV